MSAVAPGRPAIRQIGVVVHDMKAAMEAYHRKLGWGPWSVFVLEEPHHHGTEVRGDPVPYAMQIAVTTVDGIDFEVIEPLSGTSIYEEFLRERGPGIHHILCDDPERPPGALLEHLRGEGLEVLMAGRVGHNLRYQYLDGERELGVIIETYSGDVEPPTYVWPAEGHDGTVR